MQLFQRWVVDLVLPSSLPHDELTVPKDVHLFEAHDPRRLYACEERHTQLVLSLHTCLHPQQQRRSFCLVVGRSVKPLPDDSHLLLGLDVVYHGAGTCHARVHTRGAVKLL